jgi:phage tail sheath gpL-like
MTIPFDSIPSALRVPIVAVEINGSRAQQGPATLPYRALLIGQKLAAGTATADTAVQITNADQAVALAGRGSLLHRMARKWFDANKAVPVFLGVLADDAAGVAATGTVTVTGPATADGTLSLYVGGELVRVAVTSGMTATQIATAIAAVIGSTSGSTNYAVKATSALGVVTLTAHHKGAAGNELDLRVNYRDGEALPAGVTVTLVAFTGGTTNPLMTNLIANLGDSWFQIVAHPYTDATSLTAIENEMASRWGPTRSVDGLAITAKADSFANVAALGLTRNSKHSCIVRTNDSPTPPPEYAAQVAAVVALSAQNDPALPLQTLALPTVLAPRELDRDQMFSERNVLLFDGISTTLVAAGGVVQLERLITTYRTNAAGSSDTAYLSAETMLTLMYLRYSFRARVATKFSRFKLASDGTPVRSGQQIVTPKIMKAEAITWFHDMENLGLVENFDQFKNDLVVERDATDPNRLNVLLPPDVINQLVVTAAQVQFLL